LRAAERYGGDPAEPLPGPKEDAVKTALLLPTVSLGALLALQELATRYEPERAVRVTSELHIEVETQRESLRDGQPSERGGGSSSSSDTRKSAHIDRYVACADGRPTKVRRTFESAAGDVEFSFGEESMATSLETPFDGVAVEIDVDEDGELSHSVAEGSDPGQESLEKLRPELAVDALLPSGAVEEGGTWELEGPDIVRALGLDLTDVLFRRPEPEEGAAGGGPGGGGRGRGGMRGGGRGLGLRQLAEAEWSGKATYKGEAEREGVRCAVIALELECERESEDENGSSSLEAKLAGELYVALEARRPVALSVEGSLRAESESEREREGVVFETRSQSEGTFKLAYSVSETAFQE
jgi:hypothetical protein